ncbi:oxygen-independent coproporphyrinogen III oxidase [Reichenbachiella ulvae]|uniref:Coproporphyrinogen-III oxidase n=1 Tax=Reichenbachiella ulvae TaxID=2980104 RepID=A0ABT3CRQ4_9BACT|nr:oxygen-independent coproporphyrinogen III oxidase [Reichenbachiella ulvae]MCV9386251.1 oxygen-independent coproporphyrinogen III oxidase [Reichenbachiella ulvae]
MNESLIRKYNVPGPRYTSYPTVPEWTADPLDIELWKEKLKACFKTTNQSEGISLYLHLPYCESLCTYCGCNTRITINHKVELPYIDTLLAEWQLYLETFDEKPMIAEIHLGGGTPTFFSPENLKKLIDGITQKAIIKEEAAFSFEAHPNSTSEAHLQTLYDLGFRRLSLGIQDFDLKVQKIVNRVQTFETVEKVVNQARTIGYTSINFDLIYGLPLQTKETIRDTFEKVSLLKPDRIAYYSYAHVPWVKPGQRSFTEADLPSNEEKRALYELGKAILSKLEYQEIGMDHFSLPSDELYIASQKGTLHRNFMGYTTESSTLVIGLGASSIGDTGDSYAQNVKKVEEYKALVVQGQFPLYRGHFLTEEEKAIRTHIAQIMCQFETHQSEGLLKSTFIDALPKLSEFEKDNLIKVQKDHVQVLEAGKPFVRNISMAFDSHYWKQHSDKPLFSSTI